MCEIPQDESIGARGDDIWVELMYEVGDGCIIAKETWVEAYGNGDKVAILLAKLLQDNANKWNRPVVHIATATNIAAEKLCIRSGYSNKGTQGGNQIFHKWFHPEI